MVAMVGNRAKKVECLTCHGQHAYRAHEPSHKVKEELTKEETPTKVSAAAEKKAEDKKRAKSKRAQEKEKELWKEALAKKDLAMVKPYIMTNSYELDDLIDHQKFGIGIVTNVITPKKIEVLFEGGHKFMVSNYAPS